MFTSDLRIGRLLIISRKRVEPKRTLRDAFIDCVSFRRFAINNNHHEPTWEIGFEDCKLFQRCYSWGVCAAFEIFKAIACNKATIECLTDSASEDS